MSVDDEHEVVSGHPAWGKTQRKQRDKPKVAACLTLIESPRFGTILFGTLDGPVETIHKMLDEMNITRRHKAQGGSRGPRPKTS